MDLDPMAAAIARVRLRHEVGGTAAAWRTAIRCGDSLAADSWDGRRFARVAGNPPVLGQLEAGSARSASERAMLEARFEGAVTWTSVSPRWRTQRAAWVAAVSNAHTPQELAQQIVALETAMGWSAVQPSWRQERAGWVARARAVTTARDAAQLLLGLEDVTKWESVAPSWRTDRGAWVSALQSVTGA
jgi:hypothetical protein